MARHQKNKHADILAEGWDVTHLGPMSSRTNEPSTRLTARELGVPEPRRVTVPTTTTGRLVSPADVVVTTLEVIFPQGVPPNRIEAVLRWHSATERFLQEVQQ